MLILAINFKAYPTAFGEKALKISKSIEEVARSYPEAEVILIPPHTELRVIKERVDLKVFAQHADAIPYGAHTGRIPVEALKEVGVDGVMVNHSERRLRIDEIEYVVNKAKELGLRTLVCANNVEVGRSVAVLTPEMVAIEPPELIGSGIAVSKAKPEIVTDAVKRIKGVVKEVKVLVGAGITYPEDVAKALELGSEGVLVASAIMKAKEPHKVVEEFLKAGTQTLKK